jgi:hypothetical protein
MWRSRFFNVNIKISININNQEMRTLFIYSRVLNKDLTTLYSL